MFKCLVALTAVFPGAVLAAVIWTWVDENGQRHYSDREVPGATQIEIGDTQTFSGSALRQARPAAAQPSQAPAEPAETVSYSTFEIISPASEETFRNIAGNLPVTVATFPALQSGHRIDVILDGERREIGTRSLEFTLTEVWRGEHTLQAVIVDREGNTLSQTPPVTFFVHQTSILNPQR